MRLQHSLDVLLEYFARICGRDGLVINELQDEFDVRINLDSRTQTLNVTGSGSSRIDAAIERIEQLVIVRGEKAKQIDESVAIPADFIGRIIGKHGNEIRKCNEIYILKAKIVDADGGKAVHLQCSRENIASAKIALDDFVNRVKQIENAFDIPALFVDMFKAGKPSHAALHANLMYDLTSSEDQLRCRCAGDSDDDLAEAPAAARSTEVLNGFFDGAIASPNNAVDDGAIAQRQTLLSNLLRQKVSSGDDEAQTPNQRKVSCGLQQMLWGIHRCGCRARHR